MTFQRRQFLRLAAGATAVLPVVARAQQANRIRRVGILQPYPPSDAENQARVQAFREQMRIYGWTAGENIQFDERWTTDNMDLIRSAAAGLVELKSDVIVAVGGRVIPILMQMSRTIPIVVPGGSDPVGAGWIESLARPGTNVTGFAMQELSVIGKVVQTLKEIAPNISRAAIIYNPDNPSAASFRRMFESVATSLGIEPITAHVHSFADIESAVASTAARPGGGIYFPLDLTIQRFMEPSIAAVARHSLPAIYSERVFVVSGGLAYYGADRTEMFRRAASYVDRILRGEKPGDLPYQQPTKYGLAINLKTARALGLEIPAKLLFTADEVIE